MTERVHLNNFSTTLAEAVSIGETLIDVTDASDLPSSWTDTEVRLTITDGTLVEIVTVTSRTGNTLTVTRGQEGTADQAWDLADTIECRETANSFDRKADVTSTQALDFSGAESLKIPVTATFSATANGHVGIDTTVADWSHGIPKVYSGEELGVVTMPIAQFTAPTDGYVVTYNATADEFQLAAGGGGGLDNLTDVTITTPADNDVLAYNSGTTTWINQTASAAGLQAADATLDAFAAYNTNGLITQTSADTFTGRTITGTANSITVTNGSGVVGNPTIAVDSGYAGGNSIATVGTISTGVWSATDVSVAAGGTGRSVATGYAPICGGTTSTGAHQSMSSEGATGQVVMSTGNGSLPVWANSVIQMVSADISAATGTTSIPYDGTIPQNTEGTEIVTLAITPKSATSKLVIEVSMVGTLATVANTLILALFQDSTADALRATAHFADAANPDVFLPLILKHYMTSGTTSATTFKVRIGAIGGVTWYACRDSGSTFTTAMTKGLITITEYLV